MSTGKSHIFFSRLGEKMRWQHTNAGSDTQGQTYGIKMYMYNHWFLLTCTIYYTAKMRPMCSLTYPMLFWQLKNTGSCIPCYLPQIQLKCCLWLTNSHATQHHQTFLQPAEKTNTMILYILMHRNEDLFNHKVFNFKVLKTGNLIGKII